MLVHYWSKIKCLHNNCMNYQKFDLDPDIRGLLRMNPKDFGEQLTLVIVFSTLVKKLPIGPKAHYPENKNPLL